MRKIISRFVDFYLKHHFISAGVFLLILGVSGYFASNLSINSNQLDLLPQNLPVVQEARRITEMVGGTGFIILTLKFEKEDEGDRLMNQVRDLKMRGDDKQAEEVMKKASEFYAAHHEENVRNAVALKKASDEIYDALIKQSDIRYIRHRFSLDFIKRKFLYYWTGEDLREAMRRIGIKREELVARADPFYIELVRHDYHLELGDLLSHYTRIGKKEIVDDYYISPDRKMMVMVIKPTFSMNEIARSKEFIAQIKKLVEDKNFKARGITAGLTGSYVEFVDAYDSIENSLRPTLLISMAGILIILLIFIRKIRLVTALMISLIFSIIVTYGVTRVVIGQLNIITSIFGGILAGMGIDFGIQFIFRFREEYWHRQDLNEAIKESIIHTGSAAFFAALTITAAFVALIASEFRGFSEFGLVSAYGITITALSMFLVTPLVIVFMARYTKGFLDYLKQRPDEKKEEQKEFKGFNFPRLSRIILIVFLILLLPAAWFASRVAFDHDSRNMLDTHAESELLKEELHLRFEIAGDPLAIATSTAEEAGLLWEYFDPLDENLKGTIGQVVSAFAFVPPVERQLENYRLIQQFRAQNAIIKKAMIPAQYQQYWERYQSMIAEKPFTFDELPPYVTEQFRAIPSSKEQGWLTFIYPEVDKLFLAQDLANLDRLIGVVRYPIVGRRTIQRLVYQIPDWERKTGHRIQGDRTRKSVAGMMLSQRDINGVLDIVNHISEKDLKALGFFPKTNQVILAQRPFKNIEDLQKEHLEARTTGSTLLVANFTYIVQKESRFIIAGTIILVILVLYASFRKLFYPLLVLIPLSAGVLFMMAVMTIFDVKVNYFNVAVFPIIIGYGIDSGIFIFMRYLEEKSISMSMFRTGAAVFASNLTTIVGFGALAIANHPGIRSMGYLACIGLTVLMIVSLTLLPAIIQFISEKRPHFFDYRPKFLRH